MSNVSIVRRSDDLLFKSDFAPQTHIHPDLISICGRDSRTGFSWDETPAWIRDRRFVTCVWDGLNPSAFVNAEIVSAMGPRGEPANVLHLENKHPSPSHAFGWERVRAPTIRIEYQLRGNSPPNAFEEGSVRYYMKLQANLDQIVPLDVQPGWYMIMEWKEASSGIVRATGGVNNYRINIGIGREPTQRRLHWEVMAQQVQPERRTEWLQCNHEIPVPLGKWFLIEAYLRKHPTRGRVYFAVNGQIVIDKVGRTQHKDNPLQLDFWSIFKHYHAEQWYALGPTHQWYADVELWSSGMPVLS